MKIILGSKSPRRKQLLEALGYSIEMASIDCDETYPNSLAVPEIAGYLSELKAKAYGKVQNNKVLITADTIVACNNQVLGKPRNHSDAIKMLELLSDTSHEVYTGITVKSTNQLITKIDVAQVEMGMLSKEDINYYIDKYQPFDKAGGYGIQEWIGMARVKAIHGSYYTIMGLPTHLIDQLINEIKCE